MDSEERKRKFVTVLKELLENNCNGIQVRLAKQLNIRTSRISRWLAGEVDPVNLETSVFSRVALAKSCSNEELAKALGFSFVHKNLPNKFKILLEQMLSDKTQKQLGELLGVSQISISNWLNPDKDVDPSRIPVGTMFSIAHEKGWTLDDLLIYLGIKEKTIKNKLLIKYQSELLELGFKDKIKLLTLLSNSLENSLNSSETQEKNIISKNEFTIYSSNKFCIILEQENSALASQYTASLLINMQVKPENITITTSSKLSSAIIKDINALIFDISTFESTSIALINDLNFDGDIIVFLAEKLPKKVRSQLEDKVTDIVVKPLDWKSLKDKPYFAQI